MPALTSSIILVKYRDRSLSDLANLNLWGHALTDISILKDMGKLEVLILSENEIEDLSPLQHCKLLRKLSLRNNKIQNLNQVLYLSELEQLRVMWMRDNPCSMGEAYRPTVVRSLPQLSELDEKVIESDERSDAWVRGQRLVHPAARGTALSRWTSRRPSTTGSLRSITSQDSCPLDWSVPLPLDAEDGAQNTQKSSNVEPALPHHHSLPDQSLSARQSEQDARSDSSASEVESLTSHRTRSASKDVVTLERFDLAADPREQLVDRWSLEALPDHSGSCLWSSESSAGCEQMLGDSYELSRWIMIMDEDLLRFAHALTRCRMRELEECLCGVKPSHET